MNHSDLTTSIHHSATADNHVNEFSNLFKKKKYFFFLQILQDL